MESLHIKKAGKSDKVHFLAIYDISNDKIRTKLAAFFEGYGRRIQKSAFECIVNKNKFEQMIKAIPKNLGQEDSIRIYPIQNYESVISWGNDCAVDGDVVFC